LAFDAKGGFGWYVSHTQKIVAPESFQNDNTRGGCAGVFHGSIATGVPAKIGVGFSGTELQKIAEGSLPDPTNETIRNLEKRLAVLEERLREGRDNP
ncbi:MAG: hypothetical protein K9K75_07055, partial [Deltaproteobacteria bacterium]|nr:hypothetical protein [Deltaproteobacteria bacterium]